MHRSQEVRGLAPRAAGTRPPKQVLQGTRGDVKIESEAFSPVTQPHPDALRLL